MKLMNRKLKVLLSIFLAVTAIFASATELKTQLQKESYSIGASTGNYVGNQIYGQLQLGAKIDMDLVVEGFTDTLEKKSKLKEEDIIKYLNTRVKGLNDLKKALLEKLKKDNLTKEKNFLAKNGKKKGVKTTKSGLQYKILKRGKGSNTKAESIVDINYKATLIDGYEFDNTYKGKDKTPPRLSMINIVDGLKEGLMLMNEGSKFMLYVPSKLGYGDAHVREIPPNSVLIFEVELVKISKPGEGKPTFIPGHKK